MRICFDGLPRSHLMVRESIPRLFAVLKDLPQDHTVAPDITLDGVGPVDNALGWHPTNWQHSVATNLGSNGKAPT